MIFPYRLHLFFLPPALAPKLLQYARDAHGLGGSVFAARGKLPSRFLRQLRLASLKQSMVAILCEEKKTLAFLEGLKALQGPRAWPHLMLPISGLTGFGQASLLQLSDSYAASQYLLTAMVASGLGDELMECARSEGATRLYLLSGLGSPLLPKAPHAFSAEAEKDCLLAVVPSALKTSCMQAIAKRFQMDEEDSGIVFSQRLITEATPQEASDATIPEAALLQIIVPPAKVNQALALARQMGATGATLLSGRGAGSLQRMELFDLPIDPEICLLYLLMAPQDIPALFERLSQDLALNDAGAGIAYLSLCPESIGLRL